MSYKFYSLDNGVRVMLVPMRGVKSVAVGVYLGTGSRYETDRINGISHFLEHMVFKGTKKFPTHKETSYLEGLGAIQNAWTSVDATCYYCKIPANKWLEGLELVKELVLNPIIPPADLEIERGVILEEINRRDDRPDELVGEELQKMLFPNNPLGMTVLGEPGVIKKVTRNDFQDYHKQQYVAGRMVVVLAGSIEEDKVSEKIKEWFGGLKEEKGADFIKAEETQKVPEVRIKKKDLAAQAHIELAVRGINLMDPRRFALGVLNAYLGQGLSSRLFVEVREKRGLCYAIGSSNSMLEDTGFWSVYAGLNISKLPEAVKAIVAEMARIKETKLDDEELASAKEKIRGRMIFAQEDPIQQMNFYGQQALERPGEILTYDQVIDRLMLIDTQMVQNVAVDLFKTEKVNLAVVAPLEEKMAKELSELIVL